ncbi:type II secretion system protein M [Idiomarina seosinensis]|uniref:type II secretion system protein GspM n=1 Tax=Idiomarina seosinensis TaxID=281739 RepID=UPI003850EAF7
MKQLKHWQQQLQSQPVVQQAQQRWQQFNQREQRLLSALAAVLLLALLYFVIWQPSQQLRTEANQRLQAQQQQLNWVQQSLARYQALKSSQDDTASAGGSLSQRLNQAAQAQDINLARLQPQGQGMLVSIDEAGFNQVLNFIAQLENQYQMSITTLDIARLEAPGQVRVRQLLVVEQG